MKYRKRDIPKEIEVSEGIYYKIKWKQKLVEKGYYGLCFYDSKEIWISTGLTHEEAASTLVHEVMHALIHEHEIDVDRKLEHRVIYKMEEALAFFIFRNAVWIKWI